MLETSSVQKHGQEPFLDQELEMQNAIEIFREMKNCRRFQINLADREVGRIELLYGDEQRVLRDFSTDDFLRAVDYYQRYRDPNVIMIQAMQQSEGVVNVWAPNVGVDSEPRVVIQVPNYLVPQILEFAYLILRH